MYIYIQIYIYIYVHIHLCIYICTYTSIHMNTRTHMCVNLYILFKEIGQFFETTGLLPWTILPRVYVATKCMCQKHVCVLLHICGFGFLSLLLTELCICWLLHTTQFHDVKKIRLESAAEAHI